MAPERIGRYEIKAELGRGGMATVYHGYDPRFEREVAVKVLPSELLHADPQFKLRFEREAKIIAQLEHPSIVPVYDVGDEGGQPYFVMRFMNGGSLSDRIKTKVMTVEEAARILGQIAPGLDEAHSKGIVHRDLKPSNILFDAKGTPYISDFGIAKLSQSQASSVTGSAIIGTPAYMAPEQASGETVDGRSDIYALGIILFEMLTGRQPYEADTPMAVAIKHITDPVPRILDANPTLPPDVENIIQVAMAKRKEDRFTSAVELVEALRNINSPETRTQMRTRALKATAQIRPSQTKTIAKPLPRASFNIWLIIVPILLLGMMGGGYFLLNGINRPVETEPPVAVPTQTSVPATPTSAPTPAPTKEEPVVVAPTQIPTDTPIPSTPTPEPPKIPVIGGADKIAFFANGEIWLMNVDGSELERLTNDGAVKSDLQWLDQNTILFISGKAIKYYDIAAGVVDTLTSFPSEVSVDAFQISHDGKQVMIAMSNNVFVVPFDFEAFKRITLRSQLGQIEGACLYQQVAKTRTVARVREARWSSDDKLVAWLYVGNDPNNATVQSEQVDVLDISSCKPELIDLLDNFPGSRFVPDGFENRLIPDFDWNGTDQFLFNTSIRNNGWGNLYLYNTVSHKGFRQIPLGPCCFRDARWSPDGTFVLFAFQDIALGSSTFTQLYYVPVAELNTGAKFQPLPLPEDFFRNLREAPQPALRPARP
jgi:serine/threonine-protein kinase